MEQQFLKAFLEDSSEFAGITISGHFDIDITVFAAIYEHYRETGENLLDDFAMVVKEGWMPEEMINKEELIKRVNAVLKIEKLNILDGDTLLEAHRLIEKKHHNFLNYHG